MLSNDPRTSEQMNAKGPEVRPLLAWDAVSCALHALGIRDNERLLFMMKQELSGVDMAEFTADTQASWALDEWRAWVDAQMEKQKPPEGGL